LRTRRRYFSSPASSRRSAFQCLAAILNSPVSRRRGQSSLRVENRHALCHPVLAHVGTWSESLNAAAAIDIQAYTSEKLRIV
jgi:hypothetical protein